MESRYSPTSIGSRTEAKLGRLGSSLCCVLKDFKEGNNMRTQTIVRREKNIVLLSPIRLTILDRFHASWSYKWREAGASTWKSRPVESREIDLHEGSITPYRAHSSECRKMANEEVGRFLEPCTEYLYKLPSSWSLLLQKSAPFPPRATIGILQTAAPMVIYLIEYVLQTCPQSIHER